MSAWAGSGRGAEVVGGDVQAPPERAGAAVVSGGEGEGAGGAVGAGRAVSEFVVEVAGKGSVAAADVEGGPAVAGAEVLVHQPLLGFAELPVAAAVGPARFPVGGVRGGGHSEPSRACGTALVSGGLGMVRRARTGEASSRSTGMVCRIAPTASTVREEDREGTGGHRGAGRLHPALETRVAQDLAQGSLADPGGGRPEQLDGERPGEGDLPAAAGSGEQEGGPGPAG